MSKEFENNENDLITNYLFNYVFNKNKIYNISDNDLLKTYTLSKLRLELIISPECNQQCKYCYIMKHGKELYPIEERVNNKTIIKNLQILLSYFIENKILISGFDLFAGDMFFNNLFFDLTDILFNYYQTIYNEEEDFFINKTKNIFIMVPNNFSFVNDDSILPQLLKLQEKFNNIKINLCFSASIDGKILTNNREQINDKEIDKYYEKVFIAIKKLNAGIHPMVSAFGIEKWINNYKWWIDKIHEYGLLGDNDKKMDHSPNLLEVRDDNWSDEAINKYLEFIDFIIEDRLKQCNHSLEHLCYHLFCGDGKNNTLMRSPNLDILAIYCKTPQENEINCTFSENFFITLNNLKLVPCHRLTYPQFSGGQFIIENDKIKEIKAINPSGYIGLHTLNPNLHSYCLQCPINKICPKGCYGSQFEQHGECLIPNQTVCKLFQKKYFYILNKLNNLGVLKIFFESDYIPLYFKEEISKICSYYNIKIEE